MSWILFSLAAMFLWSLCNFTDKLLLERFVPDRKVAVIFGIYPAFLSLLALPFLLFFNPQAFEIAPQNAFLFIGAGFLEVLAIVLYFRALQHEDTSTVVPFFQAIPVFSLILGFILLGETLTEQQLVAGAGIVLGGVLLSFEPNKEVKRRFRTPLILLMLGASFCYALFDAIFKFAALREDFWTGIVWQHVGIALTGITLLLWLNRYRKNYLHIFTSGKGIMFTLNIINEGMYATGMVLSNYALLLAPIALVGLVNVYHPVFVFFIGGFFTILFPRLIQEDISKVSLFLKSTAVTIIVVSSIFLLV